MMVQVSNEESSMLSSVIIIFCGKLRQYESNFLLYVRGSLPSVVNRSAYHGCNTQNWKVFVPCCVLDIVPLFYFSSRRNLLLFEF